MNTTFTDLVRPMRHDRRDTCLSTWNGESDEGCSCCLTSYLAYPELTEAAAP